MSATDAVIEALLNARRTLQPVDAAPLARSLVTVDDAYLVQTAVAQELGWFDDTEGVARHWKSGGASRSALGHAPLPPVGVWASPADARPWPFHLRLIEAEVALRLGQSVDAAQAAAIDDDSATALVDAMTVSIEIVDARWQQGVQAPALLRLADLQSHGALVLGEWVPFEARDWSQQRCEVHIGSSVHEFRGTHPLGDPAFVLAQWLRHATADGAVLPAGAVVTTGTWCGVLEAQAGDAVRVVFEGLGDARVQL